MKEKREYRKIKVMEHNLSNGFLKIKFLDTNEIVVYEGVEVIGFSELDEKSKIEVVAKGINKWKEG